MDVVNAWPERVDPDLSRIENPRRTAQQVFNLLWLRPQPAKLATFSIGADTMPVSNEQRGAIKQTIRNLNRMVFERQAYTAYERDILLMELAELLPVPD